MQVKIPPMGWNSWNTFGENINEKVIMEMADLMVEQGYRDAGYEYVNIDDCYSLRERDENDRIVEDPEKFPHGMKYVSDYVHSKGLKFGIYSCAGTRTCAGYPSSYEHEFIDAKTFADWGVDFLKYDYCNTEAVRDIKRAYLTMAMALRSTGRDILFSACQWGIDNPASWMRTVGADMYRSTGDINDTFFMMAQIVGAQQENFATNGAGCFNDIDMLTVGMNGEGNVGTGQGMTVKEYALQFAYWCFMGAPLIMGADLRKISTECRDILLNKELIKINQDKETRAPYRFGELLVKDEKTGLYTGEHFGNLAYVRMLENGEFAIGYFNFSDIDKTYCNATALIGIPFPSGCRIEMTNVITGEKKLIKGELHGTVKSHEFEIYRCCAVMPS